MSKYRPLERWVMFLIIEKDYTVSFSKVETGHIRSRCRMGEISLIDVKRMRGMNLPERQEEFGGEWSEIKEYERPKT